MMDKVKIIGQSTKEGKGENQFAQPRGVCINSKTKEIFVVDCNNHRVQVFHLYSLAFVRQIGKGTQGNSPGCLMYPVGVDMDDNDHVFIADTNNHRIVVFNHLTGAYLRSIGSQGSSAGCLNCPYGICIDKSNGHLFVADYENNRIQVFDSETSAFIKVIGDGRGNGPSQFYQPIDVCIDAEKEFLLVADYSNNRVQILNKESGEFVRSIGATEGANALNGPRALCISPESNLLFISDRENHRVQMFDRNNYTLIRHIGLGFGVNPGMFNRPMELCVDSEEGVLIVVDGYNHRIQILELPELQKEKQRQKNSKRNLGEIAKDISVTPSRVASLVLNHPEYCTIKSTNSAIGLVRWLPFGGHIVSPISKGFLQQLIENNFITPPDKEALITLSRKVLCDSSADNPIFRQGLTFMNILDDVSGSCEERAVFLFAPSLLAIYSLIQRGWFPPVICDRTANRLLYLLEHLHEEATFPWERQNLLNACVELVRVYLLTEIEKLDDLFAAIIQFFSKSFDITDLVGGNFNADQSMQNPLTIYDSVEITPSSLPSSVLFAALQLALVALEKLSPTVESNVCVSNANSVLDLSNPHSSEIAETMLGSDLSAIISMTMKRRNLAESTISGNSVSSGMKKNFSAGKSLLSTIQLPELFAVLLQKVYTWKKYAMAESNCDPSVARELRRSMLCVFGKHICNVHDRASLHLQNKEVRSRGGRNIWSPACPLAPGDLIDCMDKEKSWFESLVVEVSSDGGVRVHFLGWGTKWDDTVAESERDIRIAPLNTHTRNWRSDLFEGGLIEIKCNDDMVNQKWMWGRITQLNVDESWVEVAYSFSNEPVVVKKAWLFGETICPVGMHTKDKSKAAAALITKPGKTVKEILAEKVSLGRNDNAFYDLDEDYGSNEACTLEKLKAASISATGKWRNFAILKTDFGIQALPVMAEYLFRTVLEEVSTIMAEIIGNFLENYRLYCDSSDSLAIELVPVREVIESIACTALRESLPKYFVQTLYVQAGVAAHSIAYPLQHIKVSNNADLTEVLDLADRLMQLHQLFCNICDLTLTGVVCAPSTKSYILNKLQATINYCGFTPVANEILSTVSRDSLTARLFFHPFKENAVVYPNMKRHRNFIRCLMNSGSKSEVQKLYQVMEEEIVHSSLSQISSPVGMWNNKDMGVGSIQYLKEITSLVDSTKEIINGEWINFSQMILSPERFLASKMLKFNQTESMAFGKCLAIALNKLMSRHIFSIAEFFPSLVDDLRRKFCTIFFTVGFDEIFFYFRQYFAPILFFRLIQGDYSSIAEERYMWKEFGPVADIAESILNQMESFSKLNTEFCRYLLQQFDEENIDFYPSSGDFDDLLMKVSSGKVLCVHLFKDSQIPGRILQDSFSTLRLPNSIRQVIRHFSNFCHGNGIENSSRMRWCFGLGRIEIQCSVLHRPCFNLIVNEPQFALLCYLSSCTTSQPHFSVSVGQLAHELNISVAATVHVVSSLLGEKHENIHLIYHLGTTMSELSSSTVIKFDWSSWMKTLFVCTSPWKTNSIPELNYYDNFWEVHNHSWRESYQWRESVLDASIMRHLKKVMIHANIPGSRETLNEVELANRVVRDLSERYSGQLFVEEEVFARAKVLKKKGMISSAIGVSMSSFKTPEIRFSYFSGDDSIVSASRAISSRRSNIRPGKANSNLFYQHLLSSVTSKYIPNESSAQIVNTDDKESSDGESKHQTEQNSDDREITRILRTDCLEDGGCSSSSSIVDPSLVQSFLMHIFSSISLQGKEADPKSVEEWISLTGLVVGTALGGIAMNMNDLIASVSTSASNDPPLTSKPCVDYFLSQIRSELTEEFASFGPNNSHLLQSCFLLPITAGLKHDCINTLILSFSQLVVIENNSQSVWLNHSAICSDDFAVNLSFLHQLWNEMFLLNIVELSLLPLSDWKLFLQHQLGIKDEFMREEAGYVYKVGETTENKSDSNDKDNTQEYSGFERREGDIQTRSICFGRFMLIYFKFISRKTGAQGESLQLRLMNPSYQISKVATNSRQSVSARTSILPTAASTNTHATVSSAASSKKKISKFLSEMTPAIDRIPQQIEHRPHTRSTDRIQSSHLHSDDEEDKECENFSEKSSSSQGFMNLPPPPLPDSLFANGTQRLAVVHSPPPVYRSWIEDPIIKYSKQLISENSFDNNRHQDALGDDGKPTRSIVPVLVDLSDAIPNYFWQNPPNEAVESLSHHQIWSQVIDPILQSATAHIPHISRSSKASSIRTNITYSATDHIQIGTALLDILLCYILDKHRQRNGTNSILWWTTIPRCKSVFQIVEDGILLALSLRGPQANAEGETDHWELLQGETLSLDHIVAMTNVSEECCCDRSMAECCGTDAWDQLITTQNFGTESSLTRILSQASEVLHIHWSVAAVYLSTVEWNLETLLLEMFNDDNSMDFPACSGSVHKLDHLLTEKNTVVCFSCLNATTLDELFCLGCGHYSCRECWRQHIVDSLAQTRAASTAVNLKQLLIPCQRNRCNSSASCPYVGGIELICRIMGEGETTASFLSRLLNATENEFTQSRTQRNHQYPKLFSSESFLSLTDKTSLHCQLCSHLPTMHDRLRPFSPYGQRSTVSQSGKGQSPFSPLHSVRKLADIASMTMPITHGTHLRRVLENLDLLRTRVDVCTDFIELGRCLRRQRFWRLFWECQLLLDHNQSMSILDLDLLRQVKDLIQKQVSLVADEFPISDKDGENLARADISEETLMKMLKLRKKLQQLHEFPDTSNSRLVLSPALSAVNEQRDTKYNGRFSLVSSLRKTPINRNNVVSSNTDKEFAPMLLFCGHSIQWPMRIERRFATETMKIPDQVVIPHSAVLPLTSESAMDESGLNSKIGHEKAASTSASVPTIATFASILEQLQAFATMDKVSLYMHLFALRDSLVMHESNESLQEEVASIANIGFTRQQQWLQLIDLVQYPRHDAASLGLTLLIVKLFVSHCYPPAAAATFSSVRNGSMNGKFLLPITEELIGCIGEVLQRHQHLTINPPSPPSLVTISATEDHSDAFSSYVSFEDSMLLVRQCSHLLRTLSLSPAFELRTSVAVMSSLFDGLVQLLYVQQRVDDMYQMLVEAGIAILDLCMLHNRRSSVSFNPESWRFERDDNPVMYSQGAQVSAEEDWIDRRLLRPPGNSSLVFLASHVPERDATADGGRESYPWPSLDARLQDAGLATSFSEESQMNQTESVRVGDLHTIDLVDALVSRYEDLQVVHGARQQSENSSNEDGNSESNDNSATNHLIRVPDSSGHSRRENSATGDEMEAASEFFSAESEECDRLDDLLCAVMLRIVAAAHYDRHHSNQNLREMGSGRTLDSAADTLEAVFALPAVFTQLIAALSRHTQRLQSGLRGCRLRSSTFIPSVRHSESVLSRALQVLLVLLQRARAEHTGLLSEQFQSLAEALRELCQWFLLSSTAVGGVESVETGDSNSSNSGQYGSFSNTTYVQAHCGDLLFSLTMETIAQAGRKYEPLRRALLALDISDALFFLHDAWRERPRTVSLSSRFVQQDMMRLEEAIQVISEGAALLMQTSSPPPSSTSPSHYRLLHQQLFSAAATSTNPQTTHRQRLMQAFFNGLQDADRDNNNGNFNINHSGEDRDVNELFGRDRRARAAATAAGAAVEEDDENEQMLVMDDRQLFNLNHILARMVQQEAEQESEHDEDDEDMHGLNHESVEEEEDEEDDEGSDLGEQEDEEELELNMALWREHFREHFMNPFQLREQFSMALDEDELDSEGEGEDDDMIEGEGEESDDMGDDNRSIDL